MPQQADHAVIANKPRRKYGGRPRHQPTDALRAQCAKLVGFGLTRADICAMMRIDDDTLRKYYAHELATGCQDYNVRVISALFNSAVNRHSVPAQIYWTKARAGWRDTMDVNVTSEPTTLHLLAAQLISERLAQERGDAGAPVIEGNAIVDDDAPPRE